MNGLTWTLNTFDEISTRELYTVLKLRSEVFVVEQSCVYLDMDDKDQQSWHFCGWANDELVAYTRILPPGISYPQASIGRVLTLAKYRKNGTGILLMKEAIARTYSLFNIHEIRIGAQLYLLKFYSNLGFRQTGESYLEDGIPHIEMIHSK